MLAITDALTHTTTFAYDLLNRPVTIDYPSPNADVFLAYDVVGQRTVMTDSVGVTRWGYDLLSRPLTITDPFTGTVLYTYDSAGNRLALKYPDGKTVTNTYDLASRLVTVKDWQAKTTSYAYDAANRLTTVGLPNGVTSAYGYDTADRLLNLTHQAVAQTLAAYTYTVDAVGNRTAVTDTLQSPDPADRIFADGFESGNFSAWTSSVTDAGDLSVTTAAALVGSQGTQAVLDDNNAIYVQDDTPNAEARYRARFYLDPNSLPMSNGNAHYLFYGYSGTSTQVLRVEFGRNSSQYQLRAGLRNDANSWTTSSWFTISDAPHFVELDWKASGGAGQNNGYLTLWIDAAQQANLTGIDNDTRRIDKVQLGAVAGVDSGTRGTEYFDAFESRRTTYIGPVAPPEIVTTTITYVYDALYRLTSAQYSNGTVFTYTYDAVGNRLMQQTLTQTTVYTYDIANRLTNVGPITYIWDNKGNLLNDGVYTYTYDAADRLITTTQGANTYTFKYNGLGDRLKQTANSAVTTYTLDLNPSAGSGQAMGLTQVLADGTNTYLYGNSRIAQQSVASTDYFLGDALGSVRQLANASGSVTLARSYEPYGSVLSSAGSGTTIFAFTGEIRD